MAPHIHILFFKFPSYSLMLFIGLVCFTIISILILEKKEKVDQRVTNKLLIFSAVGFIVMGIGAFSLDALFQSIEAGEPTMGGITWLGGVLVSLPITIFLIHKFCAEIKGEALKYFDFLIPGMVLAHGIGRIGCFLGGCCYGGLTDSIFGVSFPEGSIAANMYPSPNGGSLPVLPTQLFEAAFEFLLFMVMMIIYKKLKGHFLELYAISYSIFRFLLEFLRGDDRGSTGLILTPSQLMSLILFIAGICIILYNRNIIGKRIHTYMEKLKGERKIKVSASKKASDVALRALKELREDGIITETDFEAAKQKLLMKIIDLE